jgi:hypothetical protein
MSATTTADLLRLLAHLREYSQDQGLQEKYEEALRARDLADKVRATIQSRTPSRAGAFDHLTSSSEDFEANWAEQFSAFDEKMSKKRYALKLRHQEQMAEFEREWSEAMPRKYRKPSQNLLQLKAMERSLAISGQYNQAKLIHAEADVVATHEAEGLQANLIRDYRLSKERQIRRQRWDEEKLEHDIEQLRINLETKKQRESDQRANRDLVVEDLKAEGSKIGRERSGTVKPKLRQQ